MLIYGHRGASATEPENTVAAFVRAMADGADGVELDVRATADGVPVLLHDRDLARTTSGRGDVDRLTLAEVRAVDAGGGQPVPTLEEVCALIAGRLRLDLELKQAGIGREVLAVLARQPTLDWAVSSFDWDALRDLRRRAPSAPLWPLAVAADDELFAVARELAAPAVALFAAALTPDIVQRCREADLAVMAWTVNQAAEARRLRALGVAALCTDDPGAIRSVLDG
jgi:glycerophosphoryl diester phosphodiesterase